MKRFPPLFVVLVAFLAAISIAPGAAAQRLHAIVIADTSPWAGWGRHVSDVVLDSSMMQAVFSTNVPEQRLTLHIFQIGENALGDPGQVRQFIQQVPAASEDTVVVYFTGHGGNDDRGHYLAFAQGRLYREEIRALLEAKGARLNVLLTDCCNQRADGEDFCAPYIEMEPPPVVTPLFQSLFFEPRGLVDINSSSPGEGAFLGSPGEGAGSLFTGQFARFVERFRQQKTSWEHLLRSVSLNVHLAFRQTYPNGASGGKGAAVQRDQNVYAYRYPGMPAQQGPRTGFTVRDQRRSGAMIIRVRPDFPAGQVYDLSAKRYRALQPGEWIVAANSQPVRNVTKLSEIVKQSPQVMRLTIRNPRGHETDVLMRLRY